ncbi:MAG TPA: hypothetical protein VNM14_22115 [Planctomycetota bacterium]|nr:hypothetical protein [Planctomycetota bacterium]
MISLLLLLGAALGDITEIAAQRTPGKPLPFFEPDRPAEEVLAKKDGDKYLLSVRINVRRPSVEKFSEETAELTRKEWDSLVDIVSREKLLDWKPDPKDGLVFDWGTAGFRVKADKDNAPTWTTPLKNGDGPELLSKRLASLARQKISGLKLIYMSP